MTKVIPVALFLLAAYTYRICLNTVQQTSQPVRPGLFGQPHKVVVKHAALSSYEITRH
ncbi:hypothetical protein [Spirosoma agri]|uniref:Uncharacterized protein n=1 Tax=Spirosoma agri TaxID=1987381 RepID=A0A6M0IJ90_9BACT|nr:hypothetical protein [Spirosoma agri]NEU68339.1 hypothetical protein [Spirosoma agri]